MPLLVLVLVLLSVIPEPPLQLLKLVLVMLWLILPLLLVDEPPSYEDKDELGPSTIDTAPDPPTPPTALLLLALSPILVQMLVSEITKPPLQLLQFMHVIL